MTKSNSNLDPAKPINNTVSGTGSPKEFEQLYERGWLLDIEDCEEYRPGGFHPVHIGDRFGPDGRFRVIHKLGRGGLATVWLCQDQETQKYVALKFIIADQSHEKSPELRFLNQDGVGVDFGEAGGEHIVIPSSHFWHHGPNGRHLCLVLPVLGPRVSALCTKFENPASASRGIALQVTHGLNFLHKNGICHGDFRPSKILFRLAGFDELSEEDLMKKFGTPNTEPLITLSGGSAAPSGPEYLVEGLNLDRLDARFISDQVSIIDFGEPYNMQKPPEDLGITASFRSPELLFDNKIGVGYGAAAGEVSGAVVEFLGETGKCYEEDGTPKLSPKTGKPYMVMDTLEQLLSSGAVSSDDPRGKKNASGGFIVPIEETTILVDLLMGLLRYDSRERVSVEVALEHAWFRR